MVDSGVTFFVNFECREDEFDLDLEDIMVMEAIWLSIQVGYFSLQLICKYAKLCGQNSAYFVYIADLPIFEMVNA